MRALTRRGISPLTMSIPNQPRAVVTGAASGLGRALCLALARRNAQIVVADIDLAAAEETARQVVSQGGKAAVTRCDVSKPQEVAALASFADERFGGTDLLINNAGVAVSGAVGDVSLPDWEWIMGINLWGVIYGCHAFAARFKQQRRGHILNVASAAGLLSSPEMAPYNVTKAGVVSLSETLFSELRPFDVGVTVLCPTFFRTQILERSRSTGTSPELEKVASNLMDRSKLQAPDIARIALKACDDDQLFCVPMPDGQWGWRAKRLAPERYFKTILPNVLLAARKRMVGAR